MAFSTARQAAVLFFAFAFAYFFSALLRAITATLAPIFSQQLGLQAADLGLLAGAYFLGFSALQLPLGAALDRWGPKRALLALLVLAVVGCLAFAQAQSLVGLFISRVLVGMGVSACLMAPLTAYRRRFSPSAQLRANSWMLMTGSLGMMASTLPVQALLPLWGWRGIFVALAGMLVLAMLVISFLVPADDASAAVDRPPSDGGYGVVLRDPAFLRCAPMGFVIYGTMVAVQTLWAGPWLTRVARWTDQEAAQGLLLINTGMLLAFLTWGVVMPRLVSVGLSPHRLMLRGIPLSLLVLCAIVLAPTPAPAWAWAVWSVCSTVVSLSQPAVGQAFPAHLAGRALSAFNLVMFLGIFCVQWGVGLLIDLGRDWGWSENLAFRAAFALILMLSVLTYGWYAVAPRFLGQARRGE